MNHVFIAASRFIASEMSNISVKGEANSNICLFPFINYVIYAKFSTEVF